MWLNIQKTRSLVASKKMGCAAAHIQPRASRGWGGGDEGGWGGELELGEAVRG